MWLQNKFILVYFLLHLYTTTSQTTLNSDVIGFSYDEVRRDFDHFVAASGGIVNPAVNLLSKRASRLRHFHNQHGHQFHMEHPVKQPPLHKIGCTDKKGGFHFEGEVWYGHGCRRYKCLHFRGKYFIETDSCDTEIHNTTYRCIIDVDLRADYPGCCPRYRCNPDNLGNRIRSTT